MTSDSNRRPGDVTAAGMLGLGMTGSGDALIGEQISHFEIEAVLGEGGMGRVFLARDVQLDRQVALKFLSEELTADQEARARFLREARSASALDHPNIGTIYEAGEVEQVLFIAMAYYEGETLRDRMAREPVPPDEAIGILREMAGGLTAAHEAGVIHRDIKPGNVMLLSSGQVKILDFGLAKPVRVEGDDATNLTVTGATLGTIAYMSPEQARGTEVDERTDLWSLGVIAYELLSGDHPFAAEETAEMLTRILGEESPSLDPEEFPETLVDLVDGLLRRNRDERIASAAEVERAFRAIEGGSEAPTIVTATRPKETDSGLGLESAYRRLKGLAAATAAITIGTLAVFLLPDPAPALVEGEDLVLTDFVNLTGDPVFEDALTQALKIKLEESPYLDVVAPERIAETLAFMEQPVDASITRELGREICQRGESRATVTGEIAALGSKYVLTLDAVDCITGKSLAARQLEAGSKEEVLGVLGRATTDLRRDLGESLASIEDFDTPLERATTSSLEALQAYSRGRRLWHLGAAEGLPFFERAVELDPDFAMAHAILGNELANLGRYMGEALLHLERAYELVDRASEHERCTILNLYYLLALGDYARSAEFTEGCARTYPRDYEFRQVLARINNTLGRYAQAREHALVAVELRPFSPGNQMHLQLAYRGLGEIDRAREAIAFVEANASEFRPDLATDFKYYVGDLTDEELRDHWVPRRGHERTSGEVEGLRKFALHLASKGRAGEARKLFDRSAELGMRTGDMSNAMEARLFKSWSLGLLGFREEGSGFFLETVEMLGGFEDVGIAGQLIFFGEHDRGEAMLASLAVARPHSTFVHDMWAPALEGLIVLQNGDSEAALRLMERARPYDGSFGTLWALLFRGRAYLANGQAGDAVRQFEDLISFQYVAGPEFRLVIELAHLGLARAHAANGDLEAARASYEAFFERMKDADEGIPVIEEARAEYAALVG